MTSSWSDLTGLEERNKKKFTGLTFVCPECEKNFKFEELKVGIVPSGYDYLCPDDGYWIMVAEEIADLKFPQLPKYIKSEVLKRKRLGG